jgi:hypothetical protein
MTAADQQGVRIAVSPRAYRAIKGTLPAGSIVYPPERNSRGQYLLWLSEAEANRLSAIRKLGESVRSGWHELATFWRVKQAGARRRAMWEAARRSSP